jgi:hypothetical protein
MGETIAEIIRRGSPPFQAELERRYELCRSERIHTITFQNYPLGENDFEAALAAGDGPLGPYESIPAGPSLVDMGGKRVPGKINAEAQAKLAERWIAWKKYLDVVESRE